MGATGYFTASPELIEQIGTGLGVSRCALGCFHRSHQNGAAGRLVRLEQVCSCCVCGACSALPAVPWRHLLLHRCRSGSMLLGNKLAACVLHVGRFALCYARAPSLL